jgi:thiol-disulfide isomerase/thioredoxin
LKRRACVLALAAAPLGRGAAASDGPRAVPWPASRPTPGFELAAWEGPAVSLAGLRGRPVLLNFWASWCAPCRAELPSLELLETRHEAAGLRVLALNFRETDAALRRFMDETGLTLPVLRDRDGAVARAYGVRVFPSSIAIGRDGRASFSVVGEVDWSGPQARDWIAPILSRS